MTTKVTPQWSAQEKNQAKRNPVDNPYAYSRDLLLNVFSTTLPLPEDIDKSLAAFVSEPRPPLAHLPLSDIEKRVLSMVSINSEATRRIYSRDTPKKPAKEKVIAPPKKDDMWDTPTTGGSFGSNGVFGFGLKDEVRALPIKNNWSVLESQLDDTKSSPPNKKVPDVDMFSQHPFASHVPGRDPFGGFGMHEPMDYSRSAIPTTIPPFVFNPPEWVYQDPAGRIQGPFTSEQMHGWYKEGYFPPGLPIQCVGDTMFIPLLQFVEKFGNERPFLESLIEQENLEREFYLRKYGPLLGMQKTNPNPIGINPGFDRGNPYFNDPFGQPMMDPRGPNPFGMPFGHPQMPEPQPFINFMQPAVPVQNEPIEQPEVKDSIPRQPSPAHSVKSQKSAKSPKVLKEIPVPEQVPAVESAQEEAKEDTSPSKNKKKKQKKQKQVAEVEDVPPEPAVPQPAVEEPPKDVAPPKPAPWGKTEVKTEKIPLKSIQDSEAKKQAEREKLLAEKAEQKLLAEAQALAQQEQAATQSAIPATAQWATKTEKQPKKTLSQIIEDERLKKEQEEKTKQAAKGYANAAAVVKTNVKGKPSIASVVKPLSSMSIDTSDDNGWKTVGKNAVRSPITASSPAQVRPPAKSNLSPQVNTPPAKPTGPSKELLTWCRTSLKDLKGELSPDEFMNILLSLPLSETTTIKQICHDALGGFTSIDSRRFSEEFILRRQADLAGDPNSWKDNEWNEVKGGAHPNKTSRENSGTFASENKFVVVGGKKKNKK
ncbi:hypothetical protein HK103_001614 [Boothiomyces macroporosus]|uniref:GYF domain-containing protein n=1 Tax=Boothiomyces macroporosus TaxID=261099 RepID=A0AAD5Y567_9FUNG|nr:hypothetical protein HK103_001614 [Boothiomyces macroporosus]